MSLNRLVVLLTPIFAAAAGTVAAWLAEHFPGVEIDQGALQEIFIAGALIALAPAVQWLHGWQKYEARQSQLQHDLVLANATAPTAAGVATAEDPVEWEEDVDEVDDDLSALEELEELAGIDELDDDPLDDDEPAAAEV